MNNQIIFYDNQKLDCFVYSSTALNPTETSHFQQDEELQWTDFPNAQIICNFTNSLVSSLIEGIGDKITGYEISKKRPEDSVTTPLGIFSAQQLDTEGDYNEYFYLIDYNVKSNNEYSYFVSPLTEDYVQTTLTNKVLAQWDVFALTPLVYLENNNYTVVKDEYGNPINWTFLLNQSETDITLNQDKTTFEGFASKPKIAVGDLNYHSGGLSCLLGNVMCNDQYYEPNILLEKWDKMIQENHFFLFKNPKGDVFVVSLEDGTKRKYMNEIANYYKDSYNNNLSITNRPTTIDFSYIEIMDADKIRVYGGLKDGIL